MDITITKDPKQDADFTINNLREDDWVWLTLGKYAIMVKRNDIGISVDIYAKGFEDRDPLAIALAYDDTVEEAEHEEAQKEWHDGFRQAMEDPTGQDLDGYLCD